MTGSSKAVFLSYASEDAEAAQRICDGLRSAGIEVWFDKSELRGGDSWDASIRRQVKECALLVPVISANTQARKEGYFRLEWKLAVDRSHLIADGEAFLLPVTIDNVKQSDALVPERFREVQWTHLPAGFVPEDFAARVRRLLATGSASPRFESKIALSKSSDSSKKSSRTLAIAISAGLVATAIAFGLRYVAKDSGVTSTPPTAEGSSSSASAKAVPEKSIAVLPFVDMSENRDQEYFSDGLSEELLDLLSRIPELHVAARTSAFSFKGKSEDIPTIARKLQVTNVLEGSVRKSGNNLRITVQLVRADSGYHLWSQTYDRKLVDVFKVQDEIASAVVHELKTSLFTKSADTNMSAKTSDAHTLYLQARSMQMRAGDEADFRKADEYLQQALKVDPDFAPAWVVLSSIRRAQAVFGWASENQAWEEARSAARKAISLDRMLADGHVMLAHVLIRRDWNWEEARTQIDEAVKLDPGSISVLQIQSLWARMTGRNDDALEIQRKIAALDPLNSDAYDSLGKTLWMTGQLSQAAEAFQTAIALNPKHQHTYFYSGVLSIVSGNPKQAMQLFSLERDEQVARYGRAMGYNTLGSELEADATIAEIDKKNAGDDPWGIAWVYALRGDRDKAFYWINRAYDIHSADCVYIKADPLLRDLRSDPRFAEFVRKMKLPS